MRKTELSEKQKLFCYYYCQTRNGREAAAKAGYTVFCEKTAQKLLARADIREQIKKNDTEKENEKSEVYSGYRRLAFGSVTDAIRLLYYSDRMEEVEVEKMDLYNISEIKKHKDGSLEMKFFDRLKALEKMENMKDSVSEDSALPFYEAIKMGAKAVSLSRGSELNE